MAISEKNTAISGVSLFGEVVDKTCERLMDRQIKYSIRRLQEMENRLSSLELELDAFLGKSNFP